MHKNQLRGGIGIYPADIRDFSTKAVSHSEEAVQSNWRIFNNIILGNRGGALGIPLPGKYAGNNVSDDNVLGREPTFCAKTAIGSSLAEIMAALNKMLDAQGAPGAGRPHSPDGKAAPVLSLAQWRGLMGNDQHSVVARAMAAKIEGREKVTLTLEEDLGGAKIATQPIAGVDKDFFGNPMPKTNPLPGPFQNLKPGPNEFVVWPMAQ
jgi:hypothetical protein